MAYVVAAKWIAKPDEIDEVARCVALMTPLSWAYCTTWAPVF